MEQTKPTMKLGEIGTFDIKPEQIKIISKLQNCKKPSWDVAREGLQNEIFENDCELTQVTDQYESIQKKSGIQEKLNERSMNDMMLKETKLNEKLSKINEFLEECQKKTVRAENQIQSELEKQELLKKEIDEIEFDLSELSMFEKTFEKIVEEMKPYENVLNEAVEESSTFETIADFMAQCDAIMLAQEEMIKREKEFLKSVKIIREKIINSNTATSKKVLELMTKLADLELNYNKAKTAAMKWEKILSKTKDQIVESERETNTLTGSIEHLYKLLHKRKANSNQDTKDEVKFNDASDQLDFILDEVEIIERIIKRAHLKQAKEKLH